MPTYIYASRDDHIVPWRSAYQSTHLLGGNITFVLAASGHIAGVVNPPERASTQSLDPFARHRCGRMAGTGDDASRQLVAALANLARTTRRRRSPSAPATPRAARAINRFIRRRVAMCSRRPHDRIRRRRPEDRPCHDSGPALTFDRGPIACRARRRTRSSSSQEERENANESTACCARHRGHGWSWRSDLHQARRARLQGCYHTLARQHQGAGMARKHEQDGLRLSGVRLRRRRLGLVRRLRTEGLRRCRPDRRPGQQRRHHARHRHSRRWTG